MPEHLVTWTINVDGTDLLRIAQQCLEMQRDPHSIATVFEVQEIEGEGRLFRVDLSTNEVSLITADGLVPLDRVE
jgi:hypothetical protein